MKVKKNDKVKVEYTGSFDNGEIFDTSNHEGHSHPLEFEAGSGMVIKGFDDAVIGMELNEEKEIHLKPEEAYGKSNPKLMIKIPKERLPKNQAPKIGMMMGMQTPDGRQVHGRIAKIDGKEIVIDLNHPLAGKNLNFKIKVVEIN